LFSDPATCSAPHGPSLLLLQRQRVEQEAELVAERGDPSSGAAAAADADALPFPAAAPPALHTGAHPLLLAAAATGPAKEGEAA